MNQTTSKVCFVRKLDETQMLKLESVLQQRGWETYPAQYCYFKSTGQGVSIAAYRSGKLVVQGAEASDFIEFTLEPLITGAELPPPPPAPFTPHAGIDESGKGDFFGPLVVACVFVPDADAAAKLEELGVKDSKLIKNDALFEGLARKIMTTVSRKAGLVCIGPQAYNRIYKQFGNLNRLLAWGHATALEKLLEKAPECPAALADQFGDEHLIRNALQEKGRQIELRQRTKAESDIAVAAASILARAEFVRRMKLLSEACGVTLPKGAGTGVDEIAAQLAAQGGAEKLGSFAKMHFRTAYRALGLPEPPKKEWSHHH